MKNLNEIKLAKLGRSTGEVIKYVEYDNGAVGVIKHQKLSYFKNGRANMHVKTTYDVVAFDFIAIDDHASSKYNFTTTSEAIKFFNSIK